MLKKKYTTEEWCNLKRFDIGQINLQMLPQEIGYLTNLVALNVGGQSLITLPKEI